MNHAYYEFIAARKEDGRIGAILGKHAGDFLWGLIKSNRIEVWEPEDGCRDILRWAEEGLAKGDGAIARYNIREMNKALNAIRSLK